jgi:aspartate carbamoyltransferase catalytic subunit
VVVICDCEETFSPEQREELEAAGLKLRVTDELDGELPELDLVYINAIAWVGDSYEEHGVRYQLNRQSPQGGRDHPASAGARRGAVHGPG